MLDGTLHSSRKKIYKEENLWTNPTYFFIRDPVSCPLLYGTGKTSVIKGTVSRGGYFFEDLIILISSVYALMVLRAFQKLFNY